MATKSKRAKKSSAKKTTKKQRVAQKPAESKAVKQSPKPAVVDQVVSMPEPANRKPAFPARTVVIAMLIAVVAFIIFAANYSKPVTEARDVTSHEDEQLMLKVVGTDDDAANTNGGTSSTQAANALQAQSTNGTTQALPQNVQPSPTNNLQASPSTDTNPAEIN